MMTALTVDFDKTEAQTVTKFLFFAEGTLEGWLTILLQGENLGVRVWD